MLLCKTRDMRTTIDLPDALFRQTKATAALRGTSMKELIARAIEIEVKNARPAGRAERRRVRLPIIPACPGEPPLDLTRFNFDDLLT